MLIKITKKNVYLQRIDLDSYVRSNQAIHSSLVIDDGYTSIFNYFYTVFFLKKLKQRKQKIRIILPAKYDCLELAFIHFEYLNKDFVFIFNLRNFSDIPVLEIQFRNREKLQLMFDVEYATIKHGMRVEDILGKELIFTCVKEK